MSGKKTPNIIDAHVSNRIRMRRMMAGISQEKLGESLGITFQQVQKYEKGTNRIGAGRLFQIAHVLNVPVSFFYDDAPDVDLEKATGFAESTGQVAYMSDFLSKGDGLELYKAFLSIESPKVRKKFVELAKAMAEIATDLSEPSKA
jgi:transcriptional regulator with XRE-family HTH domain